MQITFGDNPIYSVVKAIAILILFYTFKSNTVFAKRYLGGQTLSLHVPYLINCLFIMYSTMLTESHDFLSLLSLELPLISNGLNRVSLMFRDTYEPNPPKIVTAYLHIKFPVKKSATFPQLLALAKHKMFCRGYIAGCILDPKQQQIQPSALPYTPLIYKY